eukprot:TRINITY_DN111654_c0_g1_i1.p1 TRINITY_DN111654_c0_g1~~TRINITY_DN111654_c0_g1_i1.p1  ORF type:complete len:528 (+),score=141.01 TRINITY_DN111654_c0_g1_i1:122-1705(+)
MGIRSEVIDRRYVFEFEVGLWSLGTIQVLKDRETNKMMTCKTVQKALVKNVAEAVQNVRRLTGLRQQHLSTVVDVLEDRNYIFVISNKTEGNDVAEFLERTHHEGNWVQEHTCASYIRQLLVGTAHAHSYHIYHKELRPNSLLLTTKLPDASVLVSDFGLSALLDPSGDALRMHDNPFVSPELTGERASKANLAAADMWSIGAIAHALLLGGPPPREGSSWMSNRHSGETASWGERSSMARDFVQQLLRPGNQRPTAAKALRHPWLRGAAFNSTSKGDSGAVANKMLCYNLALLLLPETLEFRAFHELRKTFDSIDDDRDGLVSARRVQEMLQERGLAKEVAAVSVSIADVGNCCVLDLCSAAVAEVLSSFCASSEAPSSLRAKDLAPQLLKRFFSIYGDPKRQVVMASQLRTRLCTALGREVQVRASVSYEDLLEPFEEGAAVNSQHLVAELSASQGRGTPLAVEDEEEFEYDDSDEGIFQKGLQGMGEAFDEFLSNIFQTCGRMSGNQPRGSEARIGRLVHALRH